MYWLFWRWAPLYVLYERLSFVRDRRTNHFKIVVTGYAQNSGCNDGFYHVCGDPSCHEWGNHFPYPEELLCFYLGKKVNCGSRLHVCNSKLWVIRTDYTVRTLWFLLYTWCWSRGWLEQTCRTHERMSSSLTWEHRRNWVNNIGGWGAKIGHGLLGN